jgi:hypothetical protein
MLFIQAMVPGAVIKPLKMQLNNEFAPKRLAPWYW